MYYTYLECINDPFPKENKERFKRLNLYELCIGDRRMVMRPRYYETAENKMIILLASEKLWNRSSKNIAFRLIMHYVHRCLEI